MKPDGDGGGSGKDRRRPTDDDLVDSYEVEQKEALQHEGAVNAVCLSMDGSQLACCGNDRKVTIWALPAGTLLQELPLDGWVRVPRLARLRTPRLPTPAHAPPSGQDAGLLAGAAGYRRSARREERHVWRPQLEHNVAGARCRRDRRHRPPQHVSMQV